MALASVATAETPITLTYSTVYFGDKTTTMLTGGNKGMYWADDAVYNNWIMQVDFSSITANSWKPTVTTGTAGQNGGGDTSLNLMVKFANNTYSATFGTSETSQTDEGKRVLTFDANDILTFCCYDQTLYIGTIGGDSYISYKPDASKTTAITSNSTAGSRVFANGGAPNGTTKIESVTIASLDNLILNSGESLDISKLMTTGQVQIITEPNTPSVPEPATATLSLLALAGLAGRRRRK